MPKSIVTCTQSPCLSSKNKFCADHQYLDTSKCPEKKGRIVVTIDMVDARVSSKVLPFLDGIPDNSDETVHVGCKEARNVNRFYHRTAGVMAIVRPCGVIIDYAEMLTCESPSQLFTQLLRLKCDSDVNLKYLGYDRACEFEPFLVNLSKKGNEGAKLLLKTTSFLVDKFHIKGHTTPKCDIKDSSCRYHPDLDRFSEIHNTNTECAEQAFAWLGRFKGMAKYMSHYKFKFFLFLIIRSRNVRIEKKRQPANELVEAGSI